MRTIFLSLFILIVHGLYAQPKSAMLFPEYQDGTVYMYNNQRINIPLNYDAGNHCMMYQQNGQSMILTNIHTVDSVHIGKHRFRPVKDRFYELISYNNNTLLIDWVLENIQIGYRGAYGQVTQVRTHSVNLSILTDNEFNTSVNTVTDANVYKLKNRNKYYISRNGKMLKFKDKKSLLKLFPGYKEEITQLMNKQNTDFSETEDVIALMEEVFCIDVN